MGNLFGGTAGLHFALIIGFSDEWNRLFFSDKIVLAMYGAQPA